MYRGYTSLEDAQARLHGPFVRHAGLDGVSNQVPHVDGKGRPGPLEDEDPSLRTDDSANRHGLPDWPVGDLEAIIERKRVDNGEWIERRSPPIRIDRPVEPRQLPVYSNRIGIVCRDPGLDLPGDAAIGDRPNVGSPIRPLLSQSGLEAPLAGDPDFDDVGGEGREVHGVILVTVHFVLQAGASTPGTDPGLGVGITPRTTGSIAGTMGGRVDNPGAPAAPKGVIDPLPGPELDRLNRTGVRQNQLGGTVPGSRAVLDDLHVRSGYRRSTKTVPKLVMPVGIE